jgi:hypothetical protein
MSFYLMERGWQDNEFFENAEYSERDAWCWMIGEAVWEDRNILVRGNYISLKRGQLYSAVRFMADKFKWSTNRVLRFLKRLENDRKIVKETETGQNLITICNYEEYQNQRKLTETRTETPTETGSETRTETNNNHLNQINNTTHSAREGFRLVYDTGSELFPTLATRHTAAITKWLEAGADPALDILPELRRAVGKDIRSWGYFSGAVMDAHATRLKPLPEGAPRATGQQKAAQPDYFQRTVEGSRRAVQNIEKGINDGQ